MIFPTFPVTFQPRTTTRLDQTGHVLGSFTVEDGIATTFATPFELTPGNAFVVVSGARQQGGVLVVDLVAIRRMADVVSNVLLVAVEATRGGVTQSGWVEVGVSGGAPPAGGGGGGGSAGGASTTPVIGDAAPGIVVGRPPASSGVGSEPGFGPRWVWDTTSRWAVEGAAEGWRVNRPARVMNLDAELPHLSLIRILTDAGMPRPGDSFDVSTPNLRCVGIRLRGVDGFKRSAEVDVLYSDAAQQTGISAPHDHWRVETDADLTREVTQTDALGNALEVKQLSTTTSTITHIFKALLASGGSGSSDAATKDSDILDAEVFVPVSVVSLSRSYHPRSDARSIEQIENLHGKVNSSRFRERDAGHWLCQRVRTVRDSATPSRVAVVAQFASRPGRNWMQVGVWRDGTTGLVPPEVSRAELKAAVTGPYVVERVAGRGFVKWGPYETADFGIFSDTGY